MYSPLFRFGYTSSGAVDHDLRDGRTRPAESRSACAGARGHFLLGLRSLSATHEQAAEEQAAGLKYDNTDSDVYGSH